jgi:hypothetical protein
VTYFSSDNTGQPEEFWPPVSSGYSEADVLRLVLLGAAVEAADSPYSPTAISTAAEDDFYTFLQNRDEYMREKGGEEEYRIGYETAIEEKASQERRLDDEIRNSLRTIADLRSKLYDRSTPALEAVKGHLHSLKDYEDTSASEIEKWAFEDGVKMTVSQALELIERHEKLIEDEIEVAERGAQAAEEEEEDKDA